MPGKLTLAAGLIAMGAALAPIGASAAMPAPQSRIADVSTEAGSLLQHVTHRHWRACRHWRHECADRWGWHTRGYYRCMRRHGC